MPFTFDKQLIQPADVQRVFRSAPAARRGKASTKPLACPFAVAIDTREQAPYSFAEIQAGSDKSYRPIVVETVRMTLQQGDYSIVGHESHIAIERKSKADLFGTLSAGRDRFQRELQRLANCVQWSAVVVEAEWSDILNNPPEFSGLHPQSITGSVLAWMQRYPMIHWLFLPGRFEAEATCFRILDRFWKEQHRQTGTTPTGEER